MVGEDFSGLLLRASGLKLGPSGRGGPQSGRDHEIVKDDSGMEESSGRKLNSRKLNVTDMVPHLSVFITGDSPEKARRGRASVMDSGTGGCLGKSTW